MIFETQGAIADRTIADRTKEYLGEVDRGIIMLRQLLKQQMAIVDDGGEPMNVFRDPEDEPVPPTAKRVKVLRARTHRRRPLPQGGHHRALHHRIQPVPRPYRGAVRCTSPDQGPDGRIDRERLSRGQGPLLAHATRWLPSGFAFRAKRPNGGHLDRLVLSQLKSDGSFTPIPAFPHQASRGKGLVLSPFTGKS